MNLIILNMLVWVQKDFSGKQKKIKNEWILWEEQIFIQLLYISIAYMHMP